MIFLQILVTAIGYATTVWAAEKHRDYAIRKLNREHPHPWSTPDYY